MYAELPLRPPKDTQGHSRAPLHRLIFVHTLGPQVSSQLPGVGINLAAKAESVTMTGDSAVSLPAPRTSLLFQTFALVIPSKTNLPHSVCICFGRGRGEYRKCRRA